MSVIDFSQLPTLGDIARYHARERPDAVALSFEGRDTTFAEFDRHANQAANALAAEGVSKGQRIAYVGKNSDHYFELLFGACKIGAVVTPIGWRLAPAEVAYIIEDAEAPLVFVGPEVMAHAETVGEQLARRPKVIAMESGDHGHPTFEAWRDAASPEDPQTPISPDDVAVQLYTSGTTGRPKGAMITHRNILGGRQAALAAGMDWNAWGPRRHQPGGHARRPHRRHRLGRRRADERRQGRRGPRVRPPEGARLHRARPHLQDVHGAGRPADRGAPAEGARSTSAA